MFFVFVSPATHGCSSLTWKICCISFNLWLQGNCSTQPNFRGLAKNSPGLFVPGDCLVLLPGAFLRSASSALVLSNLILETKLASNTDSNALDHDGNSACPTSASIEAAPLLLLTGDTWLFHVALFGDGRNSSGTSVVDGRLYARGASPRKSNCVMVSSCDRSIHICLALCLLYRSISDLIELYCSSQEVGILDCTYSVFANSWCTTRSYWGSEEMFCILSSILSGSTICRIRHPSTRV
jgi:hypothetical protein